MNTVEVETDQSQQDASDVSDLRPSFDEVASRRQAGGKRARCTKPWDWTRRAPRTKGWLEQCCSEATRAARNERLGGAQDFPQGLAMGTVSSNDRTRRWTCSVRLARAREREQAPPDMLTSQQCEHVCVESCPLTMRHTAKRSGDSCGESQRLRFGAEHDCDHAQAVCQSKRAT